MKTIFSYQKSIPFFLFLLSFSVVEAETVNQTAPAIYSEAMEQNLTPLDPLLEQVDYFSAEESDHGCVLQETIVYIDSNGRTYKVYHNAYKALSNGDLDGIGTDLFTYRPETDKIYVIKAETILPDGRVKPVPPEGMMIQALQQDQKSMIFSGCKQLRLVYPQVSKGSVTHFIVLIEQESSRIPDHYTGRYAWERNWQTHRKRVIMNVPKHYEERLNMVVLGDSVPSPSKTALESGRTRYEWIGEKLPVRSWEKLGGPVAQTGPMLFLSTLKDWDELAAWYAARILESSEVNDAVETVAREWAGTAGSEDEIIYNLSFRAANDIRYVSLEFGVGGLQPQPVSRVLENRFGDCKDKANFLRVLLGQHGIKSYVALINTKHAGHVEKRCADYRYFNHAILVIKKSNGDLLFCDPTIKYGSAGLIYPAIANRPALMIDHENGVSQWVKTPQKSAGELDYDLDLNLSLNGELSGWFSVKANGYYAASLSHRFEATDRESLKHETERYIGYFYDASSVIDFQLERTTPDKQDFFLKTYFIRPATGQAKLSVSWPDIKWLLPRLGDDQTVEREAFVWNDTAHVSLQIALPDTMAPMSKPDVWSVESSGFTANGKWTSQSDRLSAVFYAQVSRTHIPPPEFPKFFNAVDATHHWLEKPVILGFDQEVIAERPEDTPEGQLGEEFILMSTGDGQVDLVDHLYPAKTKAVERKMALEKTKAWFPKDLSTQFECNTRLGWLAFEQGKYQESLEIAQKTYRDYGTAVSLFSRGWVRYLEAMALEEVGKTEESLQVFSDLEADPDMNEYRRGYSAYQYARMTAEKDPETAQVYYLKAIGYNTHDEQWMLQNSYRFLLEHMPVDEMMAFLEEMRGVVPERAKSIATWLAGLGVENSAELEGLEDASKIYEILSGLSFAESELDAQQLAQLEVLHQSFQGYTEGREVLKTHLEDHSYGFWIAEPDRERSFDEYNQDIDKAIEDDDIELSARLTLWRIIHLEPEVEFPYWVWNSVRMVDYLYKNDQRDVEPLLLLLFDMRQYLPADEDGTIDLMFMQAESMAREGFVDQSLAIYQSLHDQELDNQWWDALYSRWTAALVSAGRLDEAIEIYDVIRSRLKDKEDFLPLCIQGIYTLFEEGRSEEALSWIHEAYNVCSVQEWDNELVDHLSQWIALEDAGLLEDYCKLSEQWRPQWKQVQEAAALPPPRTTLPVTFTDLEDEGRELGAAIGNEDAATLSEIMEHMLVGAKWHPALCLEAQALTAFLVQHYPEAENELYQCTVALNSEEFQLNPTNRYTSRINTLEALLDSSQYNELMALAETYYNDVLMDTDQNMYGRYGALAAINLDQAGTEWVARMEQQLEDSECRNDPYAVNIMSLLYRRENKVEDELSLLQEFIENYDGDNEQMQTRLKTRHVQLQASMESNAQLTRALNDWIETNGPAWLSCFPDPGVGDQDVSEVSRRVNEILEKAEDTQYHEAVYLLHAALDDRLDTATREDAFFNFLAESMGPTCCSRDHLARISAVIRDKRYSDSLRDLCASYAVNVALSVHMSGYLEERLLPHITGLEMEEIITENKESLNTLCNLEPYKVQTVSEWMDSIRESNKPIDGRMIFLLGVCFNDLCSMGAVDQAQEQIQNVRALRFVSNANGSGFTLQLEWQQTLDRLKEMMPIHEAMESFFMERLKPDCEKPGYVDVMFTRALDLNERRLLNRSLLQYSLYEHRTLGFWSELNDSEYLNGNICVDAGNLGELLEKLLGACKTDRQYSMAFDLIVQLFDIDDSKCMEIFNARAKEFSQQPDLRETHRALLWMKYRERIRSYDSERALTDLQTEEALSKIQRHSLMMNAMLASEDKGALETYLNTAGPDLLLGDYHIGETMLAYRMCGRDSAFELLREGGQEALREFMAMAILSGDRSSLHFTLQLAEVLDEVDELTEEWVRLVEKAAHLEDFIYLQMRLCDMREEWAAMETAAQTLTGYAPLHYDTYFYLGKALIKQGKYEEGVKAMAPFLRYCKDSINYREAQRMTEAEKVNI